LFSFANSQEALRVMPLGSNAVIVGGFTQNDVTLRVFNLTQASSILVAPEADYAIGKYIVISPESSQIAPNSYADFKVYPKTNANLNDFKVVGKIAFSSGDANFLPPVYQEIEVYNLIGSIQNEWEKLGEFRWIALLGGILLVWWILHKIL